MMNIQNKGPYEQEQEFDKQAFQGAKMFFYSFNPVTLLVFLWYTQLRSYLQLIFILTIFTLNIFVYRKCHSTKSFVLQPFSAQAFSITPSAVSQSLFQQYPPLHHCSHCNRTQKYRTKHCRKCGHCISKFDHHCFWIGNCVGETNHHYFYYFLLTQTVLNVMFIECYYAGMGLAVQGMVMAGMFLLDLGFIVFTGYLLLYHTFLVLTAQTTWEQMKRGGISYLRHLPVGYNPFSKGVVKNIREFFCGKHEGNEYRVPSIEQAGYIKSTFNICDNQYYSCC